MSSSIEITSHDDTIDLFEGKHINDLYKGEIDTNETGKLKMALE